jgi:hypothetical protein
MIDFKQTYSGKTVSAVIVGKEKEEVMAAVESYTSEYPVEGYMTSVSDIREQVDGGYGVKIWRLASCD